MLDRNISPPIVPIDDIRFASLKSCQLSCGTPLYYLDQGDQEVVRIDLMVSAGKWNQTKPLVSSLTNLMLKEGAGNLSSKQIAEQLDYYGSWLQLSDGFHYSYLTVYTLNKFFKETLAILQKMFQEPTFPEDIFETLVNRFKRQFLVNNEKVQYLANKTFVKTLFGTSHPYGQSAELDDYDRVTVDDLKEFHRRYYQSNTLRIILSGKVTDEMIATCDSLCIKNKSRLISSETGEPLSFSPEKELPRGRVFVEKKGALQNAVRMGLPVINRSHPDFPGLRVVNTLLGGYFGSRLMSSIREEKGYTYGISSIMTTLQHAAYLSIATETACEHTEALIAEVYREITRLQTEPVSSQELEMVKNYMLGDFTRSLDGTFSLIDAHLSLLATGMEVDFLHRQVEAVKKSTPEEIKSLAQRYLNKEMFVEVVAGVTQ